jgi:IMP dehydrogenase
MQLDTVTSNICFDDILLVPTQSSIDHRSEVDISTAFGNPNNPKAWRSLRVPFILAPMEFITSHEMMKKIVSFGGMSFNHRFLPYEERLNQIKVLLDQTGNSENVGFSMSNQDMEYGNYLDRVLKSGVKTLLIDTSLGHTDFTIETVKQLRKMVSEEIHIMVGNVSSYSAYAKLMEAGADSVRVGIGGGAACTTRVVTGFGVPVLSSVIDIYNKINKNEINGLISDGAIKNNGDIVKALAAGASAVMMGSMFSGHEECIKSENGSFIFRGLASNEIQIETSGGNPEDKVFHIEGVQGVVNNKGKVIDTLTQMEYNVKSGLSYCGSTNLSLLKTNAKFIIVSEACIAESRSRV